MSQPEKDINQIKEERLEKIIEQKVEEKTQKLEKQNQQLKKEIQALKSDSNKISRTNTKTSQNEGISRREFLKKAGLGTAGLAALMSPVSSLDVRSDSFNVYTGSAGDLQEYFNVSQGGPVNVMNADLDLNNDNSLINVDEINGQDVDNLGAGPDVRSSLNDLFAQVARQDFELGLERLAYRDGGYEIYSDDDKVVNTEDIRPSYGSPLNNSGFVELFSGLDHDNPFTKETSSPDEIYTNCLLHSTDTHHVLAVESDDSSVVHKLKGDSLEQVGAGLQMPRSVDNEPALFAEGHGYVDDGEELHKIDVRNMEIVETADKKYNSWNMTFFGGDIYLASREQNAVFIIDPEDLSEIDSISGFTDNSPDAVAVDNQHIYAASEGDGNIVEKYDKDTLDLLDTYEYTASDQLRATGDMDIVDETLVVWADTNEVDGNDATLILVDSADMTEIDKTIINRGAGKLEAPKDGSGFVYVSDNEIHQVDITDGIDVLRESDTTNRSKHVLSGGNIYYVDRFDDRVERVGDTLVETDGLVEHEPFDLGFVPDSLVISDEMREPLGENADVGYNIEDGDGNTKTVGREDVDTEVDLSDFTDGNITVTANLSIETSDDVSPKLDSWTAYFEGGS